MSERVTVDKGLLERLREARTAWLKYQNVREDDSEEARRMYATACELIQAAEPLPPATHPERIEHEGKWYEKLGCDPGSAEEMIYEVDIFRYPRGGLEFKSLTLANSERNRGWLSGFIACEGALYREVKPLKHEAIHVPETGTLGLAWVSLPPEFLGKSVRVTVEEVLS